MRVLVTAATRYGATAEIGQAIGEVLATTGAREHRVFAGKLVRRQLSFPERAIVSALRVPEGDFRDWAEVRGWAAGIADALSGRS